MKRDEVIKKLNNIFVDHIGMNNPISSEVLFIKVTGVNPDDLDFYERAYKWNAIKRTLALLRKSGELFVIMGQKHHYVLENRDELELYRNKVDATIVGLKRMKKKAGNWVGSKQLKKLKSKKLIPIMVE
jgi:hypothetical protein